MEKLVSVIVITYNSADYVVEALDSVLNQDYGNIELIITDDHSTDNTVNIIKDWICKNKERIDQISNFVFHQNDKNYGVSKNCNIGVSLGLGDFYQILAGDDILMSNAISEKIEYTEEYDSKIVFSKVKIIGDENAIFQIDHMKKFAKNGYEMMTKSREEQYDYLLKDNFVPGPSGGFVRRDFFEQIGGYDERFPMLEDWPFLLKYVKAGNTIKLLDKELIYYRMSRKSLSSGNDLFNKSMYDFFRIIREPELIKRGETEICKKQEKYYKNYFQATSTHNKFEISYHELYYWVYLKQSGRSLTSYFKKCGYSKIGVYGMGELYRLLSRDIDESDIKITFGIDRNAENIDSDIMIYKPDDDFPDADCIVVTPTFDFTAIKDYLLTRTNIPIVSLDDVIFES